MKYMSTRKLVEGENEQGYWVKDSKVWSITGSHHVEFIMEYPDYFNLTLEEIREMLKSNNETIENCKVTREQLIHIACSLGWVRIRHYIGNINFWSIMCDVIKLREKNIRDFIEDFAFKNKLMDYNAKLTILGLNSDSDMDTYSPSQGGAWAFLKKVGMEEGSEVKIDDLLREYR